jgi:flagellar biosynthesis protein FlhB
MKKEKKNINKNIKPSKRKIFYYKFMIELWNFFGNVSYVQRGGLGAIFVIPISGILLFLLISHSLAQFLGMSIDNLFGSIQWFPEALSIFIISLCLCCIFFFILKTPKKIKSYKEKLKLLNISK